MFYGCIMKSLASTKSLVSNFRKSENKLNMCYIYDLQYVSYLSSPAKVLYFPTRTNTQK